MTEQRNMSAVSFEDYFRLKYQTEQVDQDHVTEIIGQHDNDKTTYKEVYDVIVSVADDLSNQLNQKIGMSADMVGVLARILVNNKIISPQQEQDIVTEVLKLYEE